MKHVSVILCLCIFLSSCGITTQDTTVSSMQESSPAAEATAPEPLTPTNLEQLLEITNARREIIVKPVPDVSAVKDWDIGETEFPFDTSLIQFSFEPDFDKNAVYTLEQAASDVDYLFFFYELGYGPYFHFGGKEAFGKAKEAVLADLNNMPEITASAFEEALIKHLAFVEDAHFVINHNYNHPMLTGYLSELTFLKDIEGFMETESKARIRCINGIEDFADNMVLSVTPEGEIAYRYHVLANDTPLPAEITFDDEATKTTSMFSAHEASGKPKESEEVVTFYRIDDIPVIDITNMGFPHAKDDMQANRFLELAEELRGEPVLIIDLRSNGGGNGILPQMWYEAYTGEYVTPNHYNLFRLDLYNAFGVKKSEPDPDAFYYIPTDVTDYFTKPEVINDSWELQNPEPRSVIENDSLLIILTSKNTASAADIFTDLAFNVKNTLVVGCNTTGMGISTAANGIKMPNSGMVGQMGFNLSVFDEDHFKEGVGFMPDLWTAGDALEAAVALAKTAV